MAVPKIVPNIQAINDLAKKEFMRREMKRQAGVGIDIAKQIAPVQHGDYRDGLEADAVIEGDKAVGKMKGTNFKSRWIELGTINMAAFAVLRRAAEAAGFKVRSSR